ncbi:MAG: deoxyribose-phosphate aldolase [Tatlockia sp.]|nr:deoxyribose-phosphate aldolase [Tatlockia sp.]
MNLEERYLTVLDELKAKPKLYSSKQAISLIDLTLLEETASEEELKALGDKATQHEVAAICVFPEQLQKIEISPTIKRATVVNFPEGEQPNSNLLANIETILNNYRPDEIDYVFPYKSYFQGQKNEALAQCQQAYELCRKHGKVFKVILETGALPSLEMVYELSAEVINHGCDFLKTSTGKIAQGATLSSAFAILLAIKDSKKQCGLKVSGGIKKPEQAFNYIKIAELIMANKVDKSWFRIGASSLLNELIGQ